MVDSYRLASPQEAIYMDSFFYGPTTKYNMGGFGLINGFLDSNIFQKAHQLALGVHDAFCTKLEFGQDEVRQGFGHKPYLSSFLDFSDSPEAYQKAIDWVLEDFAQPIPLQGYPLAADVLIKLSNKLWVWYPKFHHIINDAYGHMLFTQTLTEFYNALALGKEIPKKQVFPYKDFVYEDNKYFCSTPFEKGQEFWSKKFADIPEPLPFTGSKSGLSETELLKTKRLTLNMNRYCYNSMLKICSEYEITSFHFLLASLYAYLFRTKGQDDIVIGMPILNRSNSRFRRTSGMFMSMMPLRIKVDKDWTLLDLALEIRKELMACYRYQRYPLGQIINKCRTKTGFTGNLFDITFVYRRLFYGQSFAGSSLSMYTLDSGERDESLSIEVDEYDAGNVNFFFNYNPFVIRDHEAEYFAKGIESIFLDVTLDRDKNLEKLRIMPEKQACAVFGQGVEIPEKRFEQYFSEIADKNPETEAVRFAGQGLTYAEVDKLACGMARDLSLEYGVKPGDRVAYLSERRAVSPAVILAIFRAGGVYIPIDPQYPEKRIVYILEDSQAKCLVSDRDTEVGDLPVYIPKGVQDRSNDFEINGLSPEEPAYIIYTSGTTGNPKGVIVPHKGIVNTVKAQAEDWGVEKGTKVLQFASLGFDASLSEIGMALLSGGTLVVADRETILDPVCFVELMHKEQINVATLPPSYLNSLGVKGFTHLKTLITAGESPVEQDVQRFCPKLRYINAYGPTEVSVCASWYEVAADYAGGNIPIGKAIPNGSIYILDQGLNALPPGSVGEICVGGAGVALGYLNKKKLTAEKFVQDPFCPGQNLYRTGDLGKKLFDGSIFFIGRQDSQVKIRGHRIEPEEVSRTMETLKGIDSVVVDALGQEGSKYLAAWYTAPLEMSKEKLEGLISQKLPLYMVPSAFIYMEKFPFNSNGKVDRESLPYPKPGGNKDSARTDLNDIKKTVVVIWSDVLGVHDIQSGTNFFQIGGDSLKAVKVMGRIEKYFGTRVCLKEFIATPTVHNIADIIKKKKTVSYDRIPAVVKKQRREMSPAERRVWVLSRMKGGSTAYNMPLLLDIKGYLDPELLGRAFTQAAARHEALRTYAETDEPYCRVLEECPIDVNMVQTHELNKALQEEMALPFDLTLPPLIRVKIFTTGLQSVLSVVIHHIISDGLSLQILMEEALERYKALSKGEKPGLKDKGSDYCSFAKWLEKEAGSSRMDGDREYWLQQFTDKIPELDLPEDYSRPDVLSFSGDSVHRIFEAVDWKGLENQAKVMGATSFTILLTGLYGLIYRYTGSRDTVIGTPFSGRIHPDVENTLGIFINTLPLRLRFSSKDSFMDLLDKTKLVTAEAQDHQMYPFDLLVDDLNMARQTNRQPFFDLMMILQDSVLSEMQGEGFILKTRGLKSSSSFYDMTFYFSRLGESLRLDIEYSTELYSKETVERMALHLDTFLDAALKEPKKSLALLEYIPKQEIDRITAWSTGKRESRPENSFIYRFLQMGKEYPERAAVVTPNKTVSYKEIVSSAESVCAQLQRLELGKGDTVGLAAARDEVLVAGMLGIMMSGAAYVFISQLDPERRLAFMAQSSGIKRIISGVELPASLKDISIDYKTIKKAKAEPGESGECVYYVFTSGTTGRPKGVKISPENLENLILITGQENYAGLEAPAREMITVSGAFDVSIKQVCAALSHGHTLVFPHEELVYDAQALVRYIKQEQVNILDISPSLLSMLISAGICATELSELKKLLIGSEAVHFTAVKKFMQAHPNVEILNCYGPTECTVESVKLRLDKDASYRFAVPIGRPSINTDAFVLDNNLRFCGIGVYGYIYLGGECVGIGYADQVSPAFLNQKGTRIYCTGDIGRWNFRGELEFAGRKDAQVKVRGYRVEPGEVENALLNQQGVASAAVVPFERSGFTEIAAFFSGEVEHERVKESLHETLPAYMHPARFKRLDNLPLTSGGKIDRKALTKMAAGFQSRTKFRSPRDSYQKEVYNIWSSVLETNDLDTEENFFDAGGNSVLLVRLHSRLEQNRPGLFSLAELFSKSTIESQADKLRRTEEGQTFIIEGMELPEEVLEKRAGKAPVLSAAFDGTFKVNTVKGISTLAYLFAEMYGVQKASAGIVLDGVMNIADISFEEVEDMEELYKTVQKRLYSVNEVGNIIVKGFLPLLMLDETTDIDCLNEVYGMVFKPEKSQLKAAFSERIKHEAALQMTKTYMSILDATGILG